MSVFACDLPKLRSGNPCGKFYMVGCKRRLEWSVNELGEGGRVLYTLVREQTVTEKENTILCDMRSELLNTSGMLKSKVLLFWHHTLSG